VLDVPEGGWNLEKSVAQAPDKLTPIIMKFDAAMADDLNTPTAITILEELLSAESIDPYDKWKALASMEAVLGISLTDVSRNDLRIRPKSAVITEAEIEAALARRKAARAAKDFATSDAIRDELAAKGVEVMDGDPLGWDWKL
ncbi:MAG: DALR domain-containing protein, partial [Allopontixanthobacter sediminis]